MSKTKTEANKLRAEAKRILQEQFGMQNDVENEAINRFVDCIILAATLEVASAMKEASRR